MSSYLWDLLCCFHSKQGTDLKDIDCLSFNVGLSLCICGYFRISSFTSFISLVLFINLCAYVCANVSQCPWEDQRNTRGSEFSPYITCGPGTKRSHCPLPQRQTPFSAETSHWPWFFITFFSTYCSTFLLPIFVETWISMLCADNILFLFNIMCILVS